MTLIKLDVKDRTLYQIQVYLPQVMYSHSRLTDNCV